MAEGSTCVHALHSPVGTTYRACSRPSPHLHHQQHLPQQQIAIMAALTHAYGTVSRSVSLTARPVRSVAVAILPRTPRRASLLCKAGASDGGDDTNAINVMTLERAYSTLGVPTTASFEDVLKRKNQLMSNERDQTRLMEIEHAYDLLFMQNMKKRLSGELEVSTTVRYADVPAAPSKKSASPARSASSSAPPMRAPSLPKLPSTPGLAGLQVAVKVPTNSTVTTTQAVVYSSLAAWSLLSALLESPDAQLADTAGLQLALALIYSIYTLKENKGMQIGKAMAVSMGCLLAGGLLGTLVEAWLRVDIVPIAGFGSPGVLVAEFIIAACAAGAVLLV